MPRKIRYFGIAEIATVCGVTGQAVSNWLQRGKMPKPHIRLRMGPIWTTKDPAFRKWLRENNRHQTGRSKRANS